MPNLADSRQALVTAEGMSDDDDSSTCGAGYCVVAAAAHPAPAGDVQDVDDDLEAGVGADVGNAANDRIPDEEAGRGRVYHPACCQCIRIDRKSKLQASEHSVDIHV